MKKQAKEPKPRPEKDTRSTDTEGITRGTNAISDEVATKRSEKGENALNQIKTQKTWKSQKKSYIIT